VVDVRSQAAGLRSRMSENVARLSAQFPASSPATESTTSDGATVREALQSFSIIQRTIGEPKLLQETMFTFGTAGAPALSSRAYLADDVRA